MEPHYPIQPDGVMYVPSLVAPNQILHVKAGSENSSPLSPRDLYLLQRLNIPFGQTWAIFGHHPNSAHFVQMGMLPPMVASYTAVLVGPQPQNPPPAFFEPPVAPPSEVFDPVAYEADVSDFNTSVKNA